MLRSMHALNKTQNIVVLSKVFIQKINNTTIYAEKMYSPNFSVENKIFGLSFFNICDNSYLFVNGHKVTQFKVKNSEIGTNKMFLGTLGILNLLLFHQKMFMTLRCTEIFTIFP